MADFYGSVFAAAKSGTVPAATPSGIYVGSKRRSHVEIFTMAAQASGSRLYLGTLPIGAIFSGMVLTASATLGTTTVSVGSAASPAKYKAAAVFTAVDTPTIYATAAGLAQAPLTAPEDVWMTTAAAALPGAGTMVVELLYKTQA
jgi:hypothetical protein